MKLKVENINNRLGITFPLEIIEQLEIKEGDMIDIVKTSEGIKLSLHDVEFETVMTAAEKVTDRYQNALKTLAE